MKKRLLILIMVLTLLIVAGCSRNSTPAPEPNEEPAPPVEAPVEEEPVLAEEAREAFLLILDTFPDRVSFHKELSHWGLILENGDGFEWITDSSLNEADVAMVLNANEFIEAGLDVDKLTGWLFKKAEMGMPARIIRPYDLSDQANGPEGEDTANDAFIRLINAFPNQIMFHTEMSHYQFVMDEVIFEWTTDLSMGDADLAFVLDSAPFVAAGLDVEQLIAKGWILEDGKLIKPVALD